ncbi:MAG TPA: hypothetical protein VGF28_11105 [Thermoanaerobaculia bacterium]|jgi:hypothetical protein
MKLTARDAAVVHRVFLSRFSTAQATFLYAREAAPAGGSDNWSKRLRALYDEGWLTRLYLPQSRYLAPSQWPIYCVESGVAARAAELRRPWSEIDRATRAKLAAGSAPMRDQIIRLLITEFGLDADAAAAGLRSTTQHALKLYSGEACHVPHFLLASTFCSIVWHGTARAGVPVSGILSDGGIDLNEVAAGALGSSVFPDLFFLVGETAMCVEAETGSSSRAKIEAKVHRYLALGEQRAASLLAAWLCRPVADLRVIFHCGTSAHRRMIADVIATACPYGTSLFLLTDADTFHLDYSHLDFKRNLPIDMADSSSGLYDALASLVLRCVATQVEGRSDRGAATGYVPILQLQG